MSELRANLARVRERIERASERAGREAGDVRLIAVSKTWPAERVAELARCGQIEFGENRVQEALGKIPEVAERLGPDAPAPVWHLIGPLQRNKARHAVGAFGLLHGVDSDRLVGEIDRRAAAAGIVQPVLLQVNVAGEATKSGVAPDALEPLVEVALAAAHVRTDGLMTIPPPAGRPDEARRWFDALRELRDRLARRTGARLGELSMGMSGDFEVAVEAGATLVRVGTAIFGPRPPADL